ncbi:hypothetical protein [Erwinia sp. 9145]|uniref:hypothetical protein n=1 Tax=Erwinia sp. 9145 TaxID=1500895 RepID=UPI000552C1D3|nr:hypothetical protein [Erwinia sp. 9145]
MSRNIAPGYCIVEEPGTLDFQASLLFRNSYSAAARQFLQINADTPWLKPGQIVIVTDPDSVITQQMLHSLRQVKQKANTALTGVNVDEATFLHEHYAMIAGLTRAGDKIFGVASDLGARYFSAIEQTLQKIEASYQHQYRSQGTLISRQFFVERNQLFNQLKQLVNKPLIKSLARYSVKFRPYEDIRKALNLSSRSIVHEWSSVGVAGIPGYSTYTSNAAKAARFLKQGGYIGIGFSFANVTNDVIHACTVGRENECGKFAFKEYVKFGAGTLANIRIGAYGATAGLSICAAIGVATAAIGGVTCAAIGSLATGYVASRVAEETIDIFLGD